MMKIWSKIIRVRYIELSTYITVLGYLIYFIAPTYSMAAKIPSIDCSAYNQSPEYPPAKSIEVALPSILAQKLSFYAGDFIGILGPRNWNCLEQGGNQDGTLVVFPPAGLRQDGPLVEASEVSNNIPSDGIDIGEYICRYFVNTKYNIWYGNDCKNGAWKPGPDFGGPPLPMNAIPLFHADKLQYLNRYMIKYETPGGDLGLGTSSLSDPITDLRILNEIKPSNITTKGYLLIGFFVDGTNIVGEGGLQFFKVRLPTVDTEVEEAILNFQKICYLKGNDSICSQNTVNDSQ